MVCTKWFVITPSAFFIIGFLIWGLRIWKKSQVEDPEFKIQTVEDY